VRDVLIGLLCIAGGAAVPFAVCWFENWTRGHQDGPGAGLL
jgi:hypothetical protein